MNQAKTQSQLLAQIQGNEKVDLQQIMQAQQNQFANQQNIL